MCYVTLTRILDLPCFVLAVANHLRRLATVNFFLTTGGNEMVVKKGTRKDQGGKGRVFYGRILSNIEVLALWKREDLLRWLQNNIRREKRAFNKIGVKRKYCACNLFFFSQDKFVKHTNKCPEWQKQVGKECGDYLDDD